MEREMIKKIAGSTHAHCCVTQTWVINGWNNSASE